MPLTSIQKIVHLRKVHKQFFDIARYHAGRVEELRGTNQEQAEAHWAQNLYWLEKSERVYCKLAGASEQLHARVRRAYGPDRRVGPDSRTQG